MRDRDTIDNELEMARSLHNEADFPGEDAALASAGTPDEIPLLEQDQNTYSPGSAETAHGALQQPVNFDELLSTSGEVIDPGDTIDESEDEYTV